MLSFSIFYYYTLSFSIIQWFSLQFLIHGSNKDRGWPFLASFMSLATYVPRPQQESQPRGFPVVGFLA